MKRPVLYVLAFLMVGILAGQYTHSLCGVVLFAVMAVFMSLVIFRITGIKETVFLAFIAVFGMFLIMSENMVIDENVENIAKNEKDNVYLYGIVDDIKSGDTYNQITVCCNKIEYKDYLCEKKIKILVYSRNEFIYGDILKIKGTLFKPEKSRNPGGFSERDYLALKRIHYKMFSDDIEKVDFKISFNSIVKKMSAYTSEVYDNIFPKREAAIIKAMVIGDRSGLDDITSELFKNAGIYHIIAISGMHIGIFSAAILFFADKIHKRYSKIFVIFVLFIYCIFTGASASVVRASFMMSIMLFGYIIYKPYDMISALCTAALAMLIYQPLYLFNIGFQYSFLAVFSIAVFLFPVARILKIKESAMYICSSIAVSITGKLITAYYFYTISLIDILVNIIIIPFAGIIVLFGLITGILGFISITLARLFGGIVYVVVKFYELVCYAAYKIPYTNIVCGRPSIWFIIFYIVFVVSIAYIMYFRNSKQLKKRIIYGMIFIIISALPYTVYKLQPVYFETAFLDVGQGDCIVAYKGKNCFIIDGGGRNELNDKDTGLNVLLPFLKYKGINYVECVFITHMDNDHAKGIYEIIGEVDIGCIYVSNLNGGDGLGKHILEKAKIFNVPVKNVNSGDKFLAADMELECLYPNDSSKEGNSSSIVLKGKYGKRVFLFTGDIGSEEEDFILKNNPNLSADILKLAHHGSKNSNSEQFLKVVNPRVTVVSSGKNNTYLHPSKQVVKMLNDMNIPCINTANNGAVIFKTDGENIFIRTMSEEFIYEKA